MINLNTVLQYIDFIKKNNKNNTVIFLEIEDKYYMFYNETFGVNANDLNLQFEFDGGLTKDNDVFYYVAFQTKNFDHYIKKISGYNVIFLDKNFIQKNKINRNNFLFHKAKINNDHIGLQLFDKYMKENEKENQNTENAFFIKKSKSFSFDKLDEYKSSSPRKNFTKTTSMIIEDDYVVI